MRTIAILLTALLCASALAGCAANDEGTPTPTPATSTPTDPFATPTAPATTPTPTPVTPTPVDETNETVIDETSFALEISGVPSFVGAGRAFSFVLNVTGEANLTTDHIGAHYGPNATTAPTTALLPGACEHVAGDLPGLYTVNCTIDEPGVYHLRGHARHVDAEANVTTHWWSQTEAVVSVVGSYTLTYGNLSAGLPATARANQTFTFTMNVTGDQNLTSDHIGAHYNTTSQSGDPTTAKYSEACEHVGGDVPGT
ncbi:MAG TPA: hypothetical protein VM582_07600, partial [Candidatus Thermoplasmatota archaeon]|nr:hypothetical protein [Candidatus Thermoplasmatota archaeon]